MGINKMMFDSAHVDKMPTRVRVIEYIRDNMSIDRDRWGTMFQVRDVFRMLIRLEVM